MHKLRKQKKVASKLKEDNDPCMKALELEIKELDLLITKIRFRRNYLRNKDKPAKPLDGSNLLRKYQKSNEWYH